LIVIMHNWFEWGFIHAFKHIVASIAWEQGSYPVEIASLLLLPNILARITEILLLNNRVFATTKSRKYFTEFS
jgi:hypothetical protein